MDKQIEQAIRKIIWDSYEAGANGVPPTEFLEKVNEILEEITDKLAYEPTVEDVIGPEETV